MGIDLIPVSVYGVKRFIPYTQLAALTQMQPMIGRCRT
jgi:hypothetical protein